MDDPSRPRGPTHPLSTGVDLHAPAGDVGAPPAAYPAAVYDPHAYPPPAYALDPHAVPHPPAYPPPAYAQPYAQPPYPQPGYPAQVQMHGGPMIQSLPGMPPLPQMPGVHVQISNVVAMHPHAMHPHAMHPHAMHPHAGHVPHLPPHAPHEAARPGVVEMMRSDAAHRTMEAVARRGPARVLAHGIALSASALAVLLLASIAWGTSVAAAIVGTIPLLIVACVAFVMGTRAGQGVASHHLEQAILRVAAREQGQVRVVSLAQETGCSLRECQIAIDAMVRSGHATVESDDAGNLLYRVPELEPHDGKRVLTVNATVVDEPRARS